MKISAKQIIMNLVRIFRDQFKGIILSRWLRISGWICAASLCFFVLWLFLPLSSLTIAQDPVRITDRTGELLYEVRDVDRGAQQTIELAQIPQHVIDAVIAIEDRTFFSHHGVSLRGIARALVRNITSRSREGGSTITQQLARNLLRSRNRSLITKIRETLLAIKIELHWNKKEILERYLNTAYFGHRAYGIAAAAKTYFGVLPEELSTAQSALLVGLLQAPSIYDPFNDAAAASARQAQVLQAMQTTGTLTNEEVGIATLERIRLAPDTTAIAAPHFVFWTLAHLPEDLPGTEIRTTLDLSLQQETQRIVERKLALLEDRNVTSAAVVVLDAKRGDILAMVGSADYFDEEHDGAVNVAVSPRQPGSALKPFTYALALQNGDTAATTVPDTEAQFFTQEGNPYVPRNYDFEEHGLVRYREALANSYNIAAVRVLERVGVENLLNFLRAAGLSTLTEDPEHYGLALTLGSGEVRLLELARAFAIFARGGTTLKERFLPQTPIETGERILDPKISWLIADILSDNDARIPEFGDDGPLAFAYPVAAKTGTTRNSRDNWVIGFTPERIVGVWVGNADNTPMRGTSGVTGAGPIFHEVMDVAMRGLPKEEFARPAGLTDRTICRLSGKLPTSDCPQTMEETFMEGTEPEEPDDIFHRVAIDTRNGMLAGTDCAPQFVRQDVFAVFPLEVQRWAREKGWKLPPSEVSPLCHAGAAPVVMEPHTLAITRPRNGEGFRVDPMVPNRSEKIIFEARASADITSVDWYVNDAWIGTRAGPSFRIEWPPTAGTISIEARSGEIRDRVTFTVE